MIRKALIVSTLHYICPEQKNNTSPLRITEWFGWSVVTRVLTPIFLKDGYNVSFLPQSPGTWPYCHDYPNIESIYLDPLCQTLLESLQTSLQYVNSKGNWIHIPSAIYITTYQNLGNKKKKFQLPKVLTFKV